LNPPTILVPGSSTTSGSLSVYGNTANYYSTTTYNPGQIHNFYKPGIGMIVRCFREKPDGNYVFNADFLFKTLKAKYEIENASKKLSNSQDFLNVSETGMECRTNSDCRDGLSCRSKKGGGAECR
jgi:hypothetical protein